MTSAVKSTKPGAMKTRAVRAAPPWVALPRAGRPGAGRRVAVRRGAAGGESRWVVMAASVRRGEQRVDLAGGLVERLLHGLLALEGGGQFVVQHGVDLRGLRHRGAG